MKYALNYCSSCGGRLELRHVAAEGAERHVCVACDRIHYQNPLPTAGAFIIEDGRVLLVRRAAEPFRGAWDIPGGFLEKHEHPEEALRRELREELNVEVTIERLLGVFMGTYDESGVSTLNFFYIATIASGIPRPQSDIDALEWFPLNTIPSMPFPQNNEAVSALLADYRIQKQ